jgi:DNA-binding response OmpR family regulator
MGHERLFALQKKSEPFRRLPAQPDRSGVALLKELNAQYYPAPIFIISGDDNTAFVVEAIKNGAFDYILKPFDGRSIVSRIGTAISAFAKRTSNGEFSDSSPCQLLTARESTSREDPSPQFECKRTTVDIRVANLLLRARGAATPLSHYRCVALPLRASQREQHIDRELDAAGLDVGHADVELAKVLPAAVIEHAINQRAEFLLTCE